MFLSVQQRPTSTEEQTIIPVSILAHHHPIGTPRTVLGCAWLTVHLISQPSLIDSHVDASSLALSQHSPMQITIHGDAKPTAHTIPP